MREKIVEYIDEITEEIERCVAEIEESYSLCMNEDGKLEYENAPRYHALQSRILTLTEIQGDLEGRINEFDLE